MKNIFLKTLYNSFIALIAIAFFQSAYATESSKSSLFNSLIGNSDTETFLSPEAAFQLDLSAIDSQNIQANFTVTPGYYLYKERIKFEIKQPDTSKIVKVTLPAGDIKEDPNFGTQEVYHHDFKANILLSSTDNVPVTIAVSYQGCSEKGLCYAPIKKTFTVDLNAINKSANNAAAPIAASDNDSDATTQVLKSGNLWLVIAGFFVAGLLLSLTPCVLPMIPILSSIIVGSQSQQTKPSKLHAFGLSVAYVLGMALSYTLAGIAAGLSGDLLSQSLQNALGTRCNGIFIRVIGFFNVWLL